MRSIKTSKRVITVILSLVMLFTLIPTEVVATTLEKPGTAGSTAQGNVKPEIPFTDVGEGSWYYDAVQYAYINGFFGGIDASTFKPDGTMTRGMFVTVLGRMAGVDQAAYTGLYFFEDVAEDAWYAPYVAWASRYGIADGVGNNKFNPNGLITREQLAVLLWSTAGKPEPTAPAVYSDVAEPETAKAARWAVEAGLLPDMGEGVFTPGKRVTKVQVIRAWSQLKKLGLTK